MGKVYVPSSSGYTNEGFCLSADLRALYLARTHLDHRSGINLLLVLGTQSGGSLCNVLLECAPRHKYLHFGRLGLPDPMHTLDGLRLHVQVPDRGEEDHPIRADKVQTSSSELDIQQDDFGLGLFNLPERLDPPGRRDRSARKTPVRSVLLLPRRKAG